MLGETVTIGLYRTTCGADLYIDSVVLDSPGYYSFDDLQGETGQLLLIPSSSNCDFEPIRSWPDIPQVESQPYDFIATCAP